MAAAILKSKIADKASVKVVEAFVAIKQLCKLAGINEDVRITTYKGSTRTDNVYQKWD